jgi:AraC-like DNA-binding protein
MLIMIFCIGVYAFGQIFISPFYYLRVLTEMPAQILVIAYINFIYQLYRNKLSKVVFLSCVFILFLMVFFPLFFNHKFGFSTFRFNFYEDPRTSEIIKITRLIAHSYLLYLGLYFLFIILKKYKKNNSYYLQLRKWCRGMILSLVVALFFSSCKLIFPTIIAFKYLALFFVYFAPLLIFMYRPVFLNKMPINISFLNIFSHSPVEIISTEKFNQLFFVDLYYLNEKCNSADFAETTGISQDALNYHIKINYDISFTDLVNKNRILYFIDIVNKPESKMLTLDALAKESGFSTRQNMAFFFKKFHGGSPSDYIKLIYNT